MPLIREGHYDAEKQTTDLFVVSGAWLNLSRDALACMNGSYTSIISSVQRVRCIWGANENR
jgi:hypothetical protein